MFIQTLARILADKFNLDVRYSDTSRTFSIGRRKDGSLCVTLASRLLEAKGEHEEAIGALFRGALAHEALGHGYHTDFSDDADTKEGTYAHSLANAFEDVRIESLAPARFIGARRILADMVAMLEADNFWGMPQNDDWQGALLIGLLRKYRWKILKQPLDVALTERMLQQAIQAIGEDVFRQVDSLAESACRSASTKEVSGFADQIVRLLRQQQQSQQQDQKQKPQQGKKDGKPEETSNQGDKGKQDAAGTPQGEPGKSDQGDPAQSDGAPPSDGDGDSNAASQGDKDCGKPKAPGSGKARSDFDDSRAYRVDVEAATEATEDPTNGKVRRSGLSASLDDRSESTPKLPPYVQRQLNNRIVARMAAKLENALRSVVEDADDDASEFGRLDMTKLPAITSGYETLPFLSDGKPGRGIDTEIMLVFDQSSSMNDLGVPYLRELLHASLTALSRYAPDLGISVATFNTNAVLLVKPGTFVRHNARTVPSAYHPHGGTTWSNSVATLVPILAQSHRHRKVLLTVTDGRVEASPNPALMRDIAYHGIGCRFVSIGHSLPAGFDGVVCKDTQESFADAFCEAIVQCIPREAA